MSPTSVSLSENMWRGDRPRQVSGSSRSHHGHRRRHVPRGGGLSRLPIASEAYLCTRYRQTCTVGLSRPASRRALAGQEPIFVQICDSQHCRTSRAHTDNKWSTTAMFHIVSPGAMLAPTSEAATGLLLPTMNPARRNGEGMGCKTAAPRIWESITDSPGPFVVVRQPPRGRNAVVGVTNMIYLSVQYARRAPASPQGSQTNTPQQSHKHTHTHTHADRIYTAEPWSSCPRVSV